MTSTTGKLTRIFTPRWLASNKGLEVSQSTSVESQGRSPDAVVKKSQQVHGLLATSSDDESLTKAQAVTKLKNLFTNHVIKPSRSILTNPLSTTKRIKEPPHQLTPSQSFVDAMTECHSSVNQFYGLSTQNTGDLPLPPKTGELSQLKPVKTEKTTNVVVKRTKIYEAKQNRISITEMQRRMRALTINALAPGISVVSRMTRLRDLCDHAKKHPFSRRIAINQGIIPFLLSLQKENSRLRERGLADYRKLTGVINESLAVLGHRQQINTKGIKILSIDGGGTRGLVAIETLKQLEILCGAPIHTMFDYIIGVSTGGLLAILVGALKMPLDRCEDVYKECSQRIFNRGALAGTANLLTRHSYYDMEVWEGILKEELGEDRTLLSSVRDGLSPRIALVSTVMAELSYNYVFRNYNHDINTTSQYPGTCDAKMWEAIRASSAAPGYFQDFKLGDFIHQDGGVLNNNPTAIAIHEAKMLWPDEEVQCIVSVGNGRYEPSSHTHSQDSVSSLKHKLGTIIHSATNTEDVHTVMNDLLPAQTYFRFNPYMSEDFMLNEIEEAKLQQMQYETQLYLRRNASKINKAGQRLNEGRAAHRKIQDWLSNKYHSLCRIRPTTYL